jgi:23S rRNA pseudouridine2605 synthase
VERIRLSKFIADSGVASRRKAEDLIASGRVFVNGRRIDSQGVKIDPINDEVLVDGKAVTAVLSKTYIAFHKPRGILSTMSDPEGRPCLGDYFSNRNERLFHVGRLDKESEGLILLSNDGQWAQKMAHPSHGVIKRYQVLLDRRLEPSDLKSIKAGVRLEDGVVKVIEITQRGEALELSIHEGRNQIIRRLFDSLGYTVERLARDQFGSIKLGELPPGKWRHLNVVELRNL